jgi:hypothetical protein
MLPVMAAALFATAVVVTGTGAPPVSRPNLIYILLDDLDVLLGSEVMLKQTHALIASRGARFTHFRTHAPKCTPSRTGQYAGRYYQNVRVPGDPTGDYKGKGLDELSLFEDSALFPQLHAAGYLTSVVGKLHNHQFKYFCSSSGGLDDSEPAESLSPPPAPPATNCSFPVPASGFGYRGLRRGYGAASQKSANACADKCCGMGPKECWTWQFATTGSVKGCWLGIPRQRAGHPEKYNGSEWVGATRGGPIPPEPPPPSPPANNTAPFSHVSTQCKVCGGYTRAGYIYKAIGDTTTRIDNSVNLSDWSAYSHAQFGNRSAAFVKQAVALKKPFFAYIGATGPHLPCLPAPWHISTVASWTNLTGEFDGRDRTMFLVT